LGIWDVALTEAEAVALGNATTDPNGINTLQASRNSDLGQNYPNPFTSNTIFPFKVVEKGNVIFRIFNLAGIEVTQINEGVKSPGEYKLELNAANLPNGIYTVQMATERGVSVQKMIIIR
jgi:hypothetical protein